MNDKIGFDWPDEPARKQSQSTIIDNTTPAKLTSHKERLVIERHGIDWFQCLGYPYIHADPGVDAWVWSPCLGAALAEMRKQHKQSDAAYRVVDRGSDVGFQSSTSEKISPNSQVILPRLAQAPSDAWDIGRYEVNGSELNYEIGHAAARTQMQWASAWMGKAQEAHFVIGTDEQGWLVPTLLPLAGIRMTGWPPLTMRSHHVNLLLELLDSDTTAPGMASRAWKRTKAYRGRSLLIAKLPDDGGPQRWMFAIRNTPSYLVIRECQHADIDTTYAIVPPSVCRFRLGIDDLARMVTLASIRKPPCAEFGVDTAEDGQGLLYIGEIDRKCTKIRYEEAVSVGSIAQAAGPVWWRVNLSQAKQAVAIVAGSTEVIDVEISQDPRVAVLSSATGLEMDSGSDVTVKSRSPQRLAVLPIEPLDVNRSLREWARRWPKKSERN